MNELKLNNGYFTVAKAYAFIFGLSFFPIILGNMASIIRINEADYSYFSSEPFGLYLLSAFWGLFSLSFLILYIFKSLKFRDAISKSIITHRISGDLWSRYQKLLLEDGRSIRIYGAIAIIILLFVIGTFIFFVGDAGDIALEYFSILFVVSAIIFFAAYWNQQSESKRRNANSALFIISPKAIIFNNEMTEIVGGAMRANIISASLTKLKKVDYLMVEYKYNMYRNHGEDKSIIEELLIPFAPSDLDRFSLVARDLNSREEYRQFQEPTDSNYRSQNFTFGISLAIALSLIFQFAISYYLVQADYQLWLKQ